MCAKVAVTQTAISRIFLVVPIFVSPMGLTILEKANMMPKSKVGNKMLELSLIFVHLYFAVPVALGLFPRMGTIKACDLEPEF